MSNNYITNPIYFPSTLDSVQIDNVQKICGKIESSMSDKTKQATSNTPNSSIVVDLEGDVQVINSQEKPNPSMERKVKEENKSKDDKKKKDGVKAAVLMKQTDSVHVRARRGQASDSHSLAERVRREKISERLKKLQSLVPGCDMVNSKIHKLDEIINYVQSLQAQIETPISSTLATSPPFLITVHQESTTPAPTNISIITRAPTKFVNVTPTFSSTSNDTRAIPLHENSVSLSPVQQEVRQQEQELFHNDELLCYMDYYHHYNRQEGATNLFL
ncbi:hypothetical protein MKX03_000953 [Papaver bracteatum]|nr:hypothetical protein MKX03_000953 [Papaver bracteatum]